MAPTVTYELPDPELEQYTWVWENEHAPGSQPLLTRDMFRGMFPQDPDGPPRQLRIHGYNYSRLDPDSPGFQAPPSPDDGMTAAQRWQEKWLPRVEAEFDKLMRFDPNLVPQGSWEQTIEQQAQSFANVFGGVHMQCVIPSGTLTTAFIDAYVAKFGEQRRSDALALIQGFPNQTFERANELWELSRLVRNDGSLATYLATLEADPESIGTGKFPKDFAAFLGRWGETMDMFVQDLPSWREKPRVPLNLILQNAKRPDAESPAAAQQAKAERRLALETELQEQSGDAEIADLLEKLAQAQELLPVREDHNFLCDQRLSAVSRARWLSLGRHLTSRLQTMLASKGARVVLAADGRSLTDFGSRRTHGTDAGLKSARALYIAGFDATSNVLAGECYGIPVAGTMAHSFVQAHDSELDALRAYSHRYPSGTLLVDTYDTIRGVKNVVRLAQELGDDFQVGAIRLDSGDLVDLARRARSILDQAGLDGVQIFASGGLDEYGIDDLLAAGAPIDGFGVGTNVGASADAPTLECVYKLASYDGIGRLKVSPEKATLPHCKQVFRTRERGEIRGDLVMQAHETAPGEALLQSIIRCGKRDPDLDLSLAAARERAMRSIPALPEALRARSPARRYPVEISSDLQAEADRIAAEQRGQP